MIRGRALLILLAVTAAAHAGCASRAARPRPAGGEATETIATDEPAAAPGSGPKAVAPEPPETGAEGSIAVDSLRPPPPEPEPEFESGLAASEPETVLAQSLEAYESAQQFWQEGGFEDALAALDRAYELMSSVAAEDDPTLAQEKEDLRRLISRRIVEIYASRRTVVGDIGRSIPIIINHHVEREIRSFQGAEREAFVAGYQRSGLYRPMILEELRRAGLPDQLGWLPMVESWFKVRAQSRARALGLWQFIASTGYRFGLSRNLWIDERMDPEKSTRAAVAYLTELHELFGDWMTALAAYNCGEARVLKVIRQQRLSYFDQFWDLFERLPPETRRFVPRFLATLAIVEDPARYGFGELPEPMPPLEYESVTVARSVRLPDLARSLGLEAEALATLNPELRRGATPDEPYELRVPGGRGSAMLASLERVPAYTPPVVETSVHRVRPGETLSAIAHRYGSSVESLMRLNNLRNPHRLWPGQQLQVTGGVRVGVGEVGEPIAYSVRRGDSLWIIARRFGTTVDRIRRDNGLRGNTLHPGQRLRIAATGGGGTYVVRPGDTLSGIARAARVSVRRLAEANGLSMRSTIYPGQRLALPE